MKSSELDLILLWISDPVAMLLLQCDVMKSKETDLS